MTAGNLRIFALALTLAAAVACRGGTGGETGHAGHGPAEPGHDGHGHGAGSLAYTDFSEKTELFVEFPALVVGQSSRFAAHLTLLDPVGFRPLTQGTATVVLSGGDAPEERFEAGPSEVPGIFRPVALPSRAGQRQLSVLVASDQATARHELGPVTVHSTVQAAQEALEQAGEPRTGAISFLKEQQWKVEFALAGVAERTLQGSVSANGLVRARPDGEAEITAPEAGRLLTAGQGFPLIGQAVQRGEVLALLAPRLEGADRATLEAGLARGRVELEHARRERERLEGLLTQGAVAERRVIEARLAEQAARAEVTAAEGRQAQFRATREPGGAGTAGNLEVRSPIAGVLVQAHVTAGAWLEAGAPMFDVLDLDRLWLEVQVPEADLPRAREANAAWFTVTGLEQPFTVDAEHGAHRVALGGRLDPTTRTAPLVFELPNPERRLAVGAQARVHLLAGEATSGLAIPLTALQEEGGMDVAYVQVTGESFERRVLRLGVRDRGWVQVLEGLSAGDRVVTLGSYYVRLASAASAIPAHGHAH
jgi:RND family efflux transporter MFP subunit